MIRAWHERRRAQAVRDRALADLLLTALTLATRIEQTAASFGSDRLFDQRFGRIELDASTIRKRAEAIAAGAASSHPQP